jgi:hypothetical protein
MYSPGMAFGVRWIERSGGGPPGGLAGEFEGTPPWTVEVRAADRNRTDSTHFVLMK